jgi:hypothetical protein
MNIYQSTYRYYLILLIQGIVLLQALAQTNSIGAYVMPPASLDEFVSFDSEVYTFSIGGWIDQHKGTPLKDGDKPGGERFVSYQVKLLQYWFGPYNTDEEQQLAYAKLHQLVKDPRLKPHLKYISISALYLDPDKAILLSNFPKLQNGGYVLIVSPEEDQDLQKQFEEIMKNLRQIKRDASTSYDRSMQELDRKIGQALEAALRNGDLSKYKGLQDIFGEDGSWQQTAGTKPQDNANSGNPDGAKDGTDDGSAKNGNGLKGIFPVSVSFSKWFAMMVDVFTDVIDCAFFGCQMKEKMEKVLLLAYMIMPEVMDRIASTLASLQNDLTPDKLDNALNQVADVTERIYQLYNDLKRFKELCQNPDFLTLLESLDMEDALKFVQNKALKYLERMPYCDYIPCNCISSIALNVHDEEACIREIKEKAREQVKQQLLPKASQLLARSGIPGLENMDLQAFDQLIQDKDWERFVQTQSKSMLCPTLPDEYRGACRQFIEQDYEGAIIGATGSGLARLGLNSEAFKCVLDQTRNEDYRQALVCAGKIYEKYYPEYFGPYHDVISQLIESGNTADMEKAVHHFINQVFDNKYLNSSLKISSYLMQQGINGRMNWEEAIPHIADAVQAGTGISADGMRTVLQAVGKEDYRTALQEAADIALDRYGDRFGPYQSSIRQIIRSRSEAEMQAALATFLDNTIKEEWLKKAVGTGAYLIDKSIRGEQISLQKEIERELQNQGYPVEQIKKILQGEWEIDQKQLLSAFAEEAGITSEEAIDALTDLDIDRAIDLQLDFLQKKGFGPGDQAAYLRQRLDQKLELANLVDLILRRQLADLEFRRRLIFEKKLQQP